MSDALQSVCLGLTLELHCNSFSASWLEENVLQMSTHLLWGECLFVTGFIIEAEIFFCFWHHHVEQISLSEVLDYTSYTGKFFFFFKINFKFGVNVCILIFIKTEFFCFFVTVLWFKSIIADFYNVAQDNLQFVLIFFYYKTLQFFLQQILLIYFTALNSSVWILHLFIFWGQKYGTCFCTSNSTHCVPFI